MDRRHFLQATAVTALVAQGYLPLLAAERRAKPAKRAAKNTISRNPKNIYTEPAAIEPITGYLPRFKPLVHGTMSEVFSAKYTLIACHGSAVKSKNRIRGSLDVTFSDGTCRTTEVRQASPQNIVTTELTCDGRFNTASRWTLDKVNIRYALYGRVGCPARRRVETAVAGQLRGDDILWAGLANLGGPACAV
ncbi:MAG: hypothetical protein ACYS32_16070, partial [Planctomycetota bacterium]